MEAVIFIGVPGSGKSSFFKERLFHSHVRISLDLLRTRNREQRLLELCLATEQRFVIDNTNPTKLDRSSCIEAAKAKRFKITGYYFQSKVEECLRRNSERSDRDRVPEVAILSSAKKLELPSLEEGFDQLFYVRLGESGFEVGEWRDDI
jgi:predicted kinase